MNVNKKILYILFLIIFVVFIYLLEIALFKDPYPGDIYYRFSKTELRYAEPEVIKALFVKWDTVCNYYVECSIYNNLRMPVSLDSIWIYDGDSIIYRIQYSSLIMEGNSIYKTSICLQNDVLFSDIYVGLNDPNEVMLAEHRFSSQTIFIKLFTSVGNKFLKPNHYLYKILYIQPTRCLTSGSS
jgi:hypothetical protein